jgi:ribose transport system ATP-binding protein
MNEPVLRAKGIGKRFGATRALDNVDFAALDGEIHALVGENGAGKSTLIGIFGGLYRQDQGEIDVAGKARRLATPRQAIAAGIITIPQELRLLPALSIAENIALGELPVHRTFGLATLDRRRMRQRARAILGSLDFAPDPDRPVRQLAFGERQLVAIGKALVRNCRVLILDEPTAALEKQEIERLFGVLERMKRLGVAIIYISHRLDEIVRLADRCTVLRDGCVAAVARRGELSVAALISAMSGRDTETVAAAEPRGEMLLQEARADGIGLRAGEVVGLAGLLGSGKGRVLRRLFGIEREPAWVRIKGVARRLSTPAEAVAAGLGLVPGDRGVGLLMQRTVRDNILLASLNRLWRFRGFDRRAADALVAALMEDLDIRPRRPELSVAALSGGNQQKVILAKWLAREVAVLLLDDPTRGIDSSAKAHIHARLADFAARGGGVLLASSDLGELGALCHTVVALHRGRIAARLRRDRSGIDHGAIERELLEAIGA